MTHTRTDSGPEVMPSPGTGRGRGLLVVSLVASFVAGSLLSLGLGPRTPGLGETATGDPALIADVRAALATDRGYQGLAVARVRDGQASFAGLGPDGSPLPTPQTPFELGSITKTFTGDLLADGIKRGELRLEDPVSKYLTELRGSPVGDATLEQLATHTAGLPSFPDAMMPGILLRVAANDNTSDTRSVAGMLDAARTTKITSRGTYRYSNLGVSLIGHAEARAAGVVDWPALVRARLFEPLGMRDTRIAAGAADIPDDAAPPHLDNGWPAPNWYGPAFAPAGSSTWTTAADLTRYTEALLDGSVPGATAMDPIAPIPGGSVGLAWHLREVEGRQITWHNGGTGGFRTILALDRGRGQAVVILSNSTRDADRAGLALAATPPGAPVPPSDGLRINWPSVLASSVTGLALLAAAMARLSARRSRLNVVEGTVLAGAALLILLAHGPWQLVPGWIWGGLTAVTVLLVTRAIVRLRSSAPPAARGDDGPAPRRGSRVRVGLSLGSSVLLLALAVWTL